MTAVDLCAGALAAHRLTRLGVDPALVERVLAEAVAP